MEEHECEGIDRNFPVYLNLMEHCRELIAHNSGFQKRARNTYITTRTYMEQTWNISKLVKVIIESCSWKLRDQAL